MEMLPVKYSFYQKVYASPTTPRPPPPPPPSTNFRVLPDNSKKCDTEVRQKEERNGRNREQGDHSDHSNKNSRSKSSPHASEPPYFHMRCKFGGSSYFKDNVGHTQTTYQEFGRKCNWNGSANKERDTTSRIKSGGEPTFLVSCSDRKVLDLPLKGPLKVEEIKTAFRLLALKWHPDKHQGTSKAKAAQKFKDCLNAYKSVCRTMEIS